MKKEKDLQYAEHRKGTHGQPNSYHLFNHTLELNYYVIIGQRAKVEKTWPFTAGRSDLGFAFLNRDEQPVIWLCEKGLLDTFAHELVHAISFTFERKGIQYDTENDEPHAYLMSWLFRGFYFAIK